MRFIQQLYWSVDLDRGITLSEKDLSISGDIDSGDLPIDDQWFTVKIVNWKILISHPQIYNGVFMKLQNKARLEWIEHVHISSGQVQEKVKPAFEGTDITLISENHPAYQDLQGDLLQWSLLSPSRKTTKFKPLHMYGLPGKFKVWYLGTFRYRQVFLSVVPGVDTLSGTLHAITRFYTGLPYGASAPTLFSMNKAKGMYEVGAHLIPDCPVDDFMIGLLSGSWGTDEILDYLSLMEAVLDSRDKCDNSRLWPALKEKILPILVSVYSPTTGKIVLGKSTLIHFGFPVDELTKEVAELYKKQRTVSGPADYLVESDSVSYFGLRTIPYDEVGSDPLMEKVKSLVDQVRTNIFENQNLVSWIKYSGYRQVEITVYYFDLFKFYGKTLELATEMYENRIYVLEVTDIPI